MATGVFSDPAKIASTSGFHMGIQPIGHCGRRRKRAIQLDGTSEVNDSVYGGSLSLLAEKHAT